MKKIAGRFNIGGVASPLEYRGVAAVSSDALYLYIPRAFGDLSTAKGLGMQFGLLGTLIGGAIDKATQGAKDGIRKFSFADLPPEVRELPFWKKGKPEHEVIVLPKTNVTSIKLSYFSGVRVESEFGPFWLAVGPFAIAKTRRILEDREWSQVK